MIERNSKYYKFRKLSWVYGLILFHILSNLRMKEYDNIKDTNILHPSFVINNKNLQIFQLTVMDFTIYCLRQKTWNGYCGSIFIVHFSHGKLSIQNQIGTPNKFIVIFLICRPNSSYLLFLMYGVRFFILHFVPL